MQSELSSEIIKFITQQIGTADFKILQLAGDASTRKYFRIIYADQSRVLMSWEPFQDPENYPFLNVLRHFGECGVFVPKAVAKSPELGVVLLEDLGDLTLERKFWENQNQSLAMPYYEQAIDEIVKIHFLSSKDKSPKPVCQQIHFDTAKFMWEMNYAREHFLEKVGGIQLSESNQKKLQSEFLEICETLDREPKFVCHRDYHSRNLMLKLGQVYVIDFQDARGGPLQYDLVSLFHDSYVNLNAESIQHLTKDYKNKAKILGPKDAILSTFDDIYQLQVIQRCFKACGSFSSFYNARTDRRYLKYIKHTAQLVGDTLKSQNKFPMMTAALFDFGLLEKDYEAL